jgi:anaerobic selenocysteine-containing dehydrogenase
MMRDAHASAQGAVARMRGRLRDHTVQCENRAMEKLGSFCPLDCPDACSLEATVEGPRLLRLDAGHGNPLTQGFICGKVRNIAQHIHAAPRILQPLLRSGPKSEGRFQPVDWKTALDAVEHGLREAIRVHGHESVLPYCYGGSNGFLTQDALDLRFFRRLGSSQLLRTFCAAPTGRAASGLYGRMAGAALEDYVHSRCIVLWGVNPQASGIHLVPILKEARARGAKLIVVDPRRTPLAEDADLHLQLHPGTDLPIALALAAEIFRRDAADTTFLATHAAEVDEFRRRAQRWSLADAARTSGVSEHALEQFLELWLPAAPAVIRCGWGIERTRHGGSAVAAVLALPAIAGKFGVRGGGYTMSMGGAWKPDVEALVRAPAPATRSVNMNQLGHALTELRDPPIAALWVYNANPAVTAPDQGRVIAGLQRRDLFTVVHEQVMTDTARLADVVLPATHFLEHDELARGYGSLVIQRAGPVLPAPGLARSNHSLFLEMLERFELHEHGDPVSIEDCVNALLAAAPDGERIAHELATQGFSFPPCGHTPVQFVDEFPRTTDRRIHLVAESLEQEAPGGLYHFDGSALQQSAYPFRLISPARADTITSTFAQWLKGPTPVHMAPEDAARLSLGDGQPVRVRGASGAAGFLLRIDAAMKPGTLMIHKGWWRHHAPNQFTANLFAPDTLTDLGGGACFNDARVTVEALRPRTAGKA